MGVQPASEAESKDLLTWPAGAGERNVDSHQRQWCQLLRWGNRVAGTGYDIVFLRYLNRIQEAMSTRQFNIQAWSSKRRSVLRHKPVTRAHVISRCFCEGIRGGESLSLSVFLLPFPSALCSITPHPKLILPQSFLPFSSLFLYLSVTLFYSFSFGISMLSLHFLLPVYWHCLSSCIQPSHLHLSRTSSLSPLFSTHIWVCFFLHSGLFLSFPPLKTPLSTCLNV